MTISFIRTNLPGTPMVFVADLNKVIFCILFLQAVDVWVFVGLAFIMPSLVEGAVANVFEKRQTNNKVSSSTKSEKKNEILSGQKVHSFSKICFPFAYLTFNIIYWIIYLKK